MRAEPFARKVWIAAVLAILGAFAAMPSTAAAAAEYPTQPVRIIVPFSAGGTTDLMARIIAVKLSDHLGQQTVVVNVDGAGGSVGTGVAARARPDGYTLFLDTASTGAINPALYPDLQYDMRDDFAPVSLIALSPIVLVVRNDLPVNSVAEFVALARENPGIFNYGSAGNGSVLHLSGALFAKEAGIDIVHIPYRGAGPAMNDLISGVIDLMFDNFPTGVVQVRAGTVKALGLTTLTRSPAMPELPTIAEQGYPDFDTYSWAALYVPAGTPDEIIARLSEASIAVTQDPDTIRRLNDLGAEMVGSTPEELAAFRDRQLAYWGPIVRESGARIE